eukprot:321519-Rhodomonas_salina.3
MLADVDERCQLSDHPVLDALSTDGSSEAPACRALQRDLDPFEFAFDSLRSFYVLGTDGLNKTPVCPLAAPPRLLAGYCLTAFTLAVFWSSLSDLCPLLAVIA